MRTVTMTALYARIVRTRRRLAIGASAGALAGILWLAAASPANVAATVGALVGVAFPGTIRREPGAWTIAPSLQRHSRSDFGDFRTLGDAIRIHNRVIEMLERIAMAIR